MSQSKSFTITESPQELDLSGLSTDIGAGWLVRDISDYFIEVEGNDDDLVLAAKTSFAGSTYKAITSGTIASGGGYAAVDGAAFSHMRATYAGTFPVIINIVRRVR